MLPLLLSAGCVVQPQALTDAEQARLSATDQEKIFQGVEPPPESVTVFDAMARAIRYNLDHRLKLMEDMLSRSQLDLSRAEMLPGVVASAGYTSRSNAAASSSQSVQNGTISLESSTSQNRNLKQADLALTWNILDFGVSYFRARQDADRLLITDERRRKVIQNLVREIRFAFWRAWAAQAMEGEIVEALHQADTALRTLDQTGRERLRPPLEVLRYRRSILEMVVQLEKFRDELAVARLELAPLMHVPPGSTWRLAAREPTLTAFPTDLPLEALERLALRSRPELREESYQARISTEETHKALARLFPGLELSVAGNYDSNSFLVNQHWAEAGLHLSWNLINLAMAPQRFQWSKAQEAVAETRRLALHMAILSQVHIAWRQYLNALQQYRRAMDFSSIDQEILRHVTIQRDNAAEARLEHVRNHLKMVLTRIQQYQALAQVENALGQLQVAVGTDPTPPQVADNNPATLSREIEKRITEWDRALLLEQKLLPASSPAVPGGGDPGGESATGASVPSHASRAAAFWRAVAVERVRQLLHKEEGRSLAPMPIGLPPPPVVPAATPVTRGEAAFSPPGGSATLSRLQSPPIDLEGGIADAGSARQTRGGNE
ncbi:MAG: TolC family protein [Magnetococcales bacterium]|nr:TolC family protein [Magnetococcales bacterium]